MMMALAIFVLPFALSFASGASDAGVSIEGDVSQDTITPDGGNIRVVLKSTESSPVEITVEVVKTENGESVGLAKCTVPANGTATATVFVKVGGVGEHNVTVKCTPAGYFVMNETSLLVHVTQSVWSNWTTYATIIIVAILIIAAAAYKMHSAPKIKADVTFTELEKQRKDAKGSSEPTITTEKRKYGSHRSESKEAPKKEAPKKAAAKEEPVNEAPKKEEKKVFTEMEEQRKAAAPKKEAPKEESGEPKKLKYVSSRRK